MSEMDLTREEVEEILRLLKTSSFEDLRLRRAGFELTLRRTAEGRAEPTMDSPSHRPATTEPPSARSVAEPPAAQADAVVADATQPHAAEPTPAEPDATVPIPAPIVGSFYRRPQPGAEPYVTVGSAVEADATVGLVETMKLFTAVKTGVRGRIARICAEDGQFVEYGTVLFMVAPA